MLTDPGRMKSIATSQRFDKKARRDGLPSWPDVWPLSG